MEKKVLQRNILFETNRLKVSNFLFIDIDDFMEYRNDLEWMKFQGLKGLTKEEYSKILLKDIDVTSGAQLAILKDDKLIGDIYLKKEEAVMEIGYSLNKKYTGFGYCAEAISGLLQYLKSNNVTKIIAEVEKNNINSINVLIKKKFICVSEKDNYLKFELSL